MTICQISVNVEPENEFQGQCDGNGFADCPSVAVGTDIALSVAKTVLIEMSATRLKDLGYCYPEQILA